MDTAYDVIVIGAGPNGLTCAAYLAKAGLRTLLLERRFEAGGGLSTDDFGSPFRFNLHATYMMLAELMPPHEDLELGKSVTYIRPESQVAFVYRDGKALVFYTDSARSSESVRRLCPEDAPRFTAMWSDFRRMCDDILIPATYAPPLPILDQLELLGRTELGKRVSEISEMSPRDIVESYGFRDDRVKAAVLHLATMWGLLPDSPGVGYMVPIYVYRMMNAALVKGGTHSLSSALHTAMFGAGGQYLESAEAHRIIVENGAARGIELNDGRRFGARAIVSTLNPEQTFLRLVGKDAVPPDLREAATKWEWEEWSLFTMHLGIKGDPPRYRAADFNPDVNAALLSVMGAETPDEIEQRVGELQAGRLPSPAGGGTCTSLHDSLQASRGPFGPLHTLRWESWAPYSLTDDRRWDEIKLDYANECLSAWTQHAPNLARAQVLFKYVYSPLDIERRLHTMKRGSIKHGAYTPLQMGSLRPNDLCSGYRTPLSGLYVAGASVYPGGMVTLGAGYNAARVVAEDLGASVWWTSPAYVERARQQGYL